MSSDRLPKGVKFDEGKPALDLIDPYFELDFARVLTHGALKYEPYNWKKGINLGKLIAGVRRHLNAIQRGEIDDPEWGIQHAAHAACGVMFIHYHLRTRQNIEDDRWNNEA